MLQPVTEPELENLMAVCPDKKQHNEAYLPTAPQQGAIVVAALIRHLDVMQWRGCAVAAPAHSSKM